MRRTAARTFRTAVVGSVAAALVVSTLGMFTAPAEARTQPTLVVRRDAQTRVVYDEFSRALPQSGASAPNPGQCMAAAHCDTIPLRIEVPTGIGRGDDYYVTLVLDWEKKATNLDIWLWDNKQTPKKQPGDDGFRPEDSGNEYTMINNASGAGKPAKMTIAEPRLVDYNLTVLNYAGGGFGGASGKYDITATMVVVPYELPDESVEEDPLPTSESDDGEEPTTSSDDPFVDFGPTSSPNNPFGGLSGLDLGCDPLLCQIRESDIDEDLEAALPLDVPRLEDAASAPPSAGVLLLWLVVVPVGVSLAGAALLRRRRRSAFVGI